MLPQKLGLWMFLGIYYEEIEMAKKLIPGSDAIVVNEAPGVIEFIVE